MADLDGAGEEQPQTLSVGTDARARAEGLTSSSEVTIKPRGERSSTDPGIQGDDSSQPNSLGSNPNSKPQKLIPHSADSVLIQAATSTSIGALYPRSKTLRINLALRNRDYS